VAEAAALAVDAGADMVDINMGCPAKKIIGSYSGTTLMRDSALTLALVERCGAGGCSACDAQDASELG